MTTFVTIVSGRKVSLRRSRVVPRRLCRRLLLRAAVSRCGHRFRLSRIFPDVRILAKKFRRSKIRRQHSVAENVNPANQLHKKRCIHPNNVRFTFSVVRCVSQILGRFLFNENDFFRKKIFEMIFRSPSSSTSQRSPPRSAPSWTRKKSLRCLRSSGQARSTESCGRVFSSLWTPPLTRNR
jgi:hypothetical protein